jgi:hypothetical protein
MPPAGSEAPHPHTVLAFDVERPALPFDFLHVAVTTAGGREMLFRLPLETARSLARRLASLAGAA